MKRQKFIAMIAAAVIALNTATVTKASPSVDDKKKQQEQNSQKINDLQNQNKTNVGEMSSLNEEITKLARQIDDKNRAIGEKERTLKTNENKITDLKSQIQNKQTKINTLQKSIDDKILEQKEKEELLGKRLRAIYKGSPYSEMFMFVLESKGISDFITRVENVNRVVNYDKNLIKEVNKIKEELNSVKEGIEEEKKALEGEKSNLDKLTENLKIEMQELSKAKNELDKIQNAKNTKVNSLSARNKEIANSIVQLEESNEQLENDIQKIIANSSNNNNNNSNNGGNSSNSSSGGSTSHSGRWMYPVNAPITSPFGYRTHPVTGDKKLHTGVDFGASYGTAVKAAGSGRVILASSYGGYGNTVMIDHGNGIVTLYAHNSSLNVSEGQTVQQGQVISFVGSTGVSTGPHLHFEFRTNGQPVNPMGFLN